MAKWYLFWILTINSHSGFVETLPVMKMNVDSELECRLEEKAKLEQLESQLDGEWTSTAYFGGRVRLSGILIGFEVGCKSDG